MIAKVTVVKKEFRFKMDQTFPVWFAIDKRYKRSVISSTLAIHAGIQEMPTHKCCGKLLNC